MLNWPESENSLLLLSSRRDGKKQQERHVMNCHAPAENRCPEIISSAENMTSYHIFETVRLVAALNAVNFACSSYENDTD